MLRKNPQDVLSWRVALLRDSQSPIANSRAFAKKGEDEAGGYAAQERESVRGRGRVKRELVE